MLKCSEMRSQEFDVSKMINFSCYSFIILPHTSHVFIKIEQCLAYHAFNLKFTMFCTHYGHLVVNCSPYFYRNCPLNRMNGTNMFLFHFFILKAIYFQASYMRTLPRAEN